MFFYFMWCFIISIITINEKNQINIIIKNKIKAISILYITKIFKENLFIYFKKNLTVIYENKKIKNCN